MSDKSYELLLSQEEVEFFADLLVPQGRTLSTDPMRRSLLERVESVEARPGEPSEEGVERAALAFDQASVPDGQNKFREALKAAYAVDAVSGKEE